MKTKRTHCKRGHPFSPENTKVRPSKPGKRNCRACENLSAKGYARRHKRIRRDLRTRGKLYDLTRAEADALYLRQQGRCAICRQPERRIRATLSQPQRLALDHDHKTNKTRGYLCALCNLALGQFGDDLRLLQAAVRYLKLYQQKEVRTPQLRLIK